MAIFTERGAWRTSVSFLFVIVIVVDGMGNNLEGRDSELERSLAP